MTPNLGVGGASGASLSARDPRRPRPGVGEDVVGAVFAALSLPFHQARCGPPRLLDAEKNSPEMNTDGLSGIFSPPSLSVSRVDRRHDLHFHDFRGCENHRNVHTHDANVPTYVDTDPQSSCSTVRASLAS